MFKKPAAALAAVLLLVTGPAAALEEAKITAGAERPYNYTVWGESAAAPYAYLPAGWSPAPTPEPRPSTSRRICTCGTARYTSWTEKTAGGGAGRLPEADAGNPSGL